MKTYRTKAGNIIRQTGLYDGFLTAYILDARGNKIKQPYARGSRKNGLPIVALFNINNLIEVK